METGTISTGTVSSMIIDSIVMINIECPPLPQGVDGSRRSEFSCIAVTEQDSQQVRGGEYGPVGS